MATDLKIDYSKTNQLSKNVKAKGDEFKTLLSKIKTANTTLKTHWQGADADKYTGAIDEQAKTMDQLQKTIDEVSVFLAKVSKAYEEANLANQQGIK